MRFYLAELIELFCLALCSALNHVGGCWVLNRSPLGKLHWWAVRQMVYGEFKGHYPPPSHHVCQTCGFDHNDFVTRQQMHDYAEMCERRARAEAIEELQQTTVSTTAGTAGTVQTIWRSA